MIDKEDEMKTIFNKYHTIAVVGLSRDPLKDSYIVAEYLRKKGYNIIPINPSADEILGVRSYKSLMDMPEELQKTISCRCF
jgi:uncharacterized protein